MSTQKNDLFLIQEAHKSINNLEHLAFELSNNYFNASTYDLIRNTDQAQRETLSHTLRKEILETSSFKGTKYARNILVIGAGCTFNAFENIPLGNKAVSEIQKKIIIDQEKNLTFETFSKVLFMIKNNETVFTKEEEALKEVLQQEFHLFNGIGQKYYDNYNKLKLHSPDYEENNDIDFETSLNLLANVLPHTTVRKAIQEIFNYKHGAIPFYEIVAHLFKHRFIDVIINFNFDEFLDEALNDELGEVSFDTILSDGDCRDFDTLCENGRLRQPLYIKPHGTASHKSTLRFTKDQYYELPTDLRVLIEKVVSAEEEPDEARQDRSANLITVGFEMGSLEFNEILSKKLPPKSKIFTFYYHDKNAGHEQELNIVKKLDKRTKRLNKIFKARKKTEKPSIYNIGHEFFEQGSMIFDHKTPFELSKDNTTLGNTFELLFEYIFDCFIDLYKPQPIYRHKLIMNIFGNKVFWRKVNKASDRAYPKDYFTTSEYFKDRVLIEILINLCQNKGRIDPPLLMNGRAGKYYKLYYDKTKEKIKNNTSEKEPIALNKLLKFIFSSDIHPLKMQFKNTLFRQKFSATFQYFYSLTQSETSMFSDNLQKRFKELFASKDEKQDIKSLIYKNFEGIIKSNRSLIQSDFRGSTHHIFKDYSKKNLLNTELAIDIHYLISCTPKSKVNTLLLISERGFYLSRFIPLAFKKKLKIKLLLANQDTMTKGFDNKRKIAITNIVTNWGTIERDEIMLNYFLENIELNFLPINRHNHHMMVFLNQQSTEKGESITLYDEVKTNRAIYYHQQGLCQKVNPIILFDKWNIDSLISKYGDYSKSSISS